MPNGHSDEWIVKLADSLTSLKISTGNVESKIDQLSASMEKLEYSISELKNVSNNQETRITVIEQRQELCQSMIPERLNEDFALMKSQVASYQKFLWLVAAAVAGLVAKTLLQIIP